MGNGDDGHWYFPTHDSEFVPVRDKPRSLQVKAGTGLSGRKMLELLDAIPAQKLLLLVNACYSGKVAGALDPSDEDEEGGVPLPDEEALAVLGTGEGRAVLTASRSSQKSYIANDGRLSYFGRAIVAGLRGQGVPNHGNCVGLYELYGHVYETVKRSALDERGQSQEPELTVLRQVGPSFPVALYPGAGAGTLDPTALQQDPPPRTAL